MLQRRLTGPLPGSATRPDPESSRTATTSTPARSCATVHRAASPRCAFPVSIMGRTVGVIHATGQPDEAVDENQIQDLTTLAKLAGARIGLLRVMAETQLQASTDTLTGLLNRRSFSDHVAAVPGHLHPVSVAMVDLDHFKALNDTYGHETGDRALRLFARVLRDTLRTGDVVSRYGGEEFAIAFPDCSTDDAAHALNAVRAQLDAAITVGGLPKFTASFGVTDTEPGEETRRRPATRRRRSPRGEAPGPRPGRPARLRNEPGRRRPGADRAGAQRPLRPRVGPYRPDAVHPSLVATSTARWP